MRKLIAAALVLVLFLSGIVPNTRVAQAGDGPIINRAPAIRVWQIDSRAADGSGQSNTAIMVVFDSTLYEIEHLWVGIDDKESPITWVSLGAAEVGGTRMVDFKEGLRQGWTWLHYHAAGPHLVTAKLMLIGPDGRREETSTDLLVDPAKKFGENRETVWLFLETKEARPGGTVQLRSVWELDFPVVRREVCVFYPPIYQACTESLAGADWSIPLNPEGEEKLSFALVDPSRVKEVPPHLLSGTLANGSQIAVEYTTLDGRSHLFVSQPLYFY